MAQETKRSISDFMHYKGSRVGVSPAALSFAMASSLIVFNTSAFAESTSLAIANEGSATAAASTTVGSNADSIDSALPNNTTIAVSTETDAIQSYTVLNPDNSRTRSATFGPSADNTFRASRAASTQSSGELSNQSIQLGGSHQGLVLRVLSNNSSIATVSTIIDNNATGSLVTANSAAAAAASSNSVIAGNSILLEGGISNSAGFGVLITSESSAEARAGSVAIAINDNNFNNAATGQARSVASSASAAFSQSVVGRLGFGNRIDNIGSILSSGDGINITATSFASATALATAGAESEGDGVFSSANGIGQGQPVFYGFIHPSSGFANSQLEVSAKDVVGSSSSIAVSLVEGNVLNNAGIIVSESGDGISLIADATATSSSVSQVAATAAVRGNTLTNTGLLYAGDDGISLNAREERIRSIDSLLSNAQLSAHGSTVSLSVGGQIIGNTVDNISGGRIVARDIGIAINDAGTANVVRGNTINNSGLIVSDSALALSGSTLTKGAPFAFNSGTSTTHVGTAIWIDGSATGGAVAGENVNVVNLSEPSYIAGQFMFGRASNVNVNLASGVSHSVRWVFADNGAFGAEGFDTSGSVPWFSRLGAGGVQDNTPDEFATIDPSAFASAPNQLADLTSMVSGMAREGLDRGGIERNGAWVAVRGSRMNYAGDNRATGDQRTRLTGLAVGVNRDFEQGRIGLVLGKSEGGLNVGSAYPDLFTYSYENRAEATFFGVHGYRVFDNSVRVDLALSLGAVDHTDKRFVNDNLQWWGVSYANSDYKSRFVSPEINISREFALTDTLTLTPNLYGRYTTQRFKGYTENGSNANAVVGARTLSVGELGFGMKLEKSLDENGSTVSGNIGLMGRKVMGQDYATVKLIGDTQNVSYFNRGVHAMNVGANLNLAINEGTQLKLNASYLKGTHVSGGSIGGTLRFLF